jgi:hypothetical protein
MTSVFLDFMLGLLNPPNRRIRFHMYGAVGGAESRDSPLSRFVDSVPLAKEKMLGPTIAPAVAANLGS